MSVRPPCPDLPPLSIKLTRALRIRSGNPPHARTISMRDSFRAILAENKRLLRDISVLGEQLRTAHANVGQLQEANASLKRECARLAIERDDARRRWRETAVTQAQTHAKYYVLGTRQASLHRLLDDVLPIAAQKAMETGMMKLRQSGLQSASLD